ncbi:hypothetical protein [Burkholderia metallica]|uniref:hypothetical protein n=1 Tax=Burkholderia metallica TaxID=488729 RepID=UPI001CF1B30F|nr:hypothetical protein [Burkholderia metallica]MCA8003472.1 hypothetical protein [Burkholderia metallica]
MAAISRISKRYVPSDSTRQEVEPREIKTRAVPDMQGPLSGLAQLSSSRQRAAFGTNQRGQRIAQNELPFAGYLFLRSAGGRKLEGKTLENATSANKMLEDSRKDIVYGRGNVFDDYYESDGQSTDRVATLRKLVANLVPPPSGQQSQQLTRHEAQAADLGSMAAQTVFMKAGNCEEYSSVAAEKVVRTDSLRLGGSVQIVKHETDHGWAEWKPGEHRKDQESLKGETWVIDGWSDGPAILIEDGKLSQERDRIEVRTHVDENNTSAFKKGQQLANAFLSHSNDDELVRMAEDMRMLGHEPDRLRLPVFDEVNGRKILAKMDSPEKAASLTKEQRDLFVQRTALRKDIHAAGIAMSLGVSNPGEAAAVAPTIVEAAKKLSAAI